MDQRKNFLALILLDALEDENESDVYGILERNSVDASFVPRERGIAPIHYACGMKNEQLAIDICKIFLERGANPNVRTDENMTPLHVSAIYGRTEIVKLLLQHGAQLEVYDDERKMPLHYAIDEYHFDVVQLMRDHIFLNKYESKRQDKVKTQVKPMHTLLSESRFEESLQKQTEPTKATSTPSSNNITNGCINKHLQIKNQSINVDTPGAGKYTPNRIHYNYDVTSPYYINITHRRHKPQPVYPAEVKPTDSENECDHKNENGGKGEVSVFDALEHESVNLFSLTKENLKELTQHLTAAERTSLSIIETWREKVQNSRARQSILKEFDNAEEMVENVMENEHLNYTNTMLKEKLTLENGDAEVDSGACGSTSATSMTEVVVLPPKTKKPAISLGELIQKIAKAHVVSIEPQQSSMQPSTSPTPLALTPKTQNNEAESSYQTVPEFPLTTDKETTTQRKVTLQVPDQNTSVDFIRSPRSVDYFLQMTEAYVHTDDENGLVFYETKLLSNQASKALQLRSGLTPKPGGELDTTVTSNSTNLTLPFDYETDALRTELTTFGEPPGPITKSTKRLYIKRLIKYKRKTAYMQEIQKQQQAQLPKFSVELQRTLRTGDAFGRVADYLTFENQSAKYFANHKQKKDMREGHLKQSFIYMLIDPRISCNLPGESLYLEKLDVWKRFLNSVFYVGKGKTSRPYSHLYDAMKTHSRKHDKENKNSKKISIRRQALNVELFKSPPKQSSDSQKLDRILDIWGHGNGVVCLHVFHNIVPTEAYTREAAIIDALSLKHLTNIKRGDYYGPAKTWTMKEKKCLGIALLYKAMQIYLAEGESQLSPSDLI